MFGYKLNVLTVSAFLALFGGMAFWTTPSFVSAENATSSQVHPVGMNSQSPGWAERLKGQTIVEDAMEGRAERAALVEQQHQRMMKQMQKEMDHKGADTGAFNSMSMIHQYGGGPENGLLASNSNVEPVSMKGGLCPKTAPVRNYDVSAVNVEITLNQWLDYYPGYMYALTENISWIIIEPLKIRIKVFLLTKCFT